MARSWEKKILWSPTVKDRNAQVPPRKPRLKSDIGSPQYAGCVLCLVAEAGDTMKAIATSRIVRFARRMKHRLLPILVTFADAIEASLMYRDPNERRLKRPSQGMESDDEVVDSPNDQNRC
jgi:hypothetical protein